MTGAVSMSASRYRSPFADCRRRSGAIALLALLHLVALLCLIGGGSAGRSENPGVHGARAGLQKLFALHPPSTDVGTPQRGGGELGAVRAAMSRESKIERVRPGAGDEAINGDAGLGDDLAGVLADDPFAGGGLSSYETILRLHIAEHGQGARGKLQRPGVVLVRFRVARDGEIIDARVLSSPNSRLSELALAALWRSEPLPRVPDELSVPLEVDVPIRVRS